jgi:hypothetical protein
MWVCFVLQILDLRSQTCQKATNRLKEAVYTRGALWAGSPGKPAEHESLAGQGRTDPRVYHELWLLMKSWLSQKNDKKTTGPFGLCLPTTTGTLNNLLQGVPAKWEDIGSAHREELMSEEVWGPGHCTLFFSICPRKRILNHRIQTYSLAPKRTRLQPKGRDYSFRLRKPVPLL